MDLSTGNISLTKSNDEFYTAFIKFVTFLATDPSYNLAISLVLFLETVTTNSFIIKKCTELAKKVIEQDNRKVHSQFRLKVSCY